MSHCTMQLVSNRNSNSQIKRFVNCLKNQLYQITFHMSGNHLLMVGSLFSVKLNFSISVIGFFLLRTHFSVDKFVCKLQKLKQKKNQLNNFNMYIIKPQPTLHSLIFQFLISYFFFFQNSVNKFFCLNQWKRTSLILAGIGNCVTLI